MFSFIRLYLSFSPVLLSNAHCVTLSETDAMAQTLRGTGLATPFPLGPNVGDIGRQLRLIARLISIRNERGHGINRDVFYCEMGGEHIPWCFDLSYFNGTQLILFLDSQYCRL